MAGALVGFVDPGGVVAQGGAAVVGVTESAGDGAQVDAGGDEFGRRIVTELVQGGADPRPVTRWWYRRLSVSGTGWVVASAQDPGRPTRRSGCGRPRPGSAAAVRGAGRGVGRRRWRGCGRSSPSEPHAGRHH